MSALVPVALVSAAVWLVGEPGERRLVRRLGAKPVTVTPGEDRKVRRLVLVVAAILVVAMVGLTAGRTPAVVAVVGFVLGSTAIELHARAVRRRRERAERGDVVQACDVIAGLLRVGSVPATALAAAASEHPVLAEAAALQAVGGLVPPALRRSAQGPGREGLADLAAAWEIAVRTGASLTLAVDAVGADLARRDEAAAQVRVELAGARAATRMLAVLPVVGLLVSGAVGADPAGFLLGHPLGNGALVAATGLSAVGLLWSDALADRASR